MISIGEESGHLPQMLNKAVSYIQEEVDLTIRVVESLSESAIIVVIAAIVIRDIIPQCLQRK